MLNSPRLSQLPDFVAAAPVGAPTFSDYRRAAFPMAGACDELRQHIARLASAHPAAAAPQPKHTALAAPVLEKAAANA